jgi:hypothetical protein
MIELATFIASAAAIIWARKHDIHNILNDQRSRNEVAEAILYPERRLTLNLKRVEAILNRLLKGPLASIWFCLMLSLVYTSISFLFSLAFVTQPFDFMGASTTIDPDQAKLLFSCIVFVAAILFSVARLHMPVATAMSKKGARQTVEVRSLTVLLINLTLALAFVFMVYAAYGSSVLTLCALFFAVPSATFCNCGRSNYVIAHTMQPYLIFFPCGLGFFGMLSALCYFIANDINAQFTGFISFIFTSSIVFGVLGAASLSCSEFKEIGGTEIVTARRLPPVPVAIASVVSWIGRPALYGGFYCSRAPGCFCLAVATLIFVSTILNRLLPEPIVIPTTIILISAIFLAGAKSIVGAGSYALCVALFVTFYTYSAVPKLFFGKWAYVFVFWIVLPFLGAIFDWTRWNVVRKYISFTRQRQAIKQGALFLLFILGDSLFGVLCIVLFAVLAVSAIALFNKTAVADGYTSSIDIIGLLTRMHKNENNAALWYAILVAAFLIPTFVSIFVYASSGLNYLVPKATRVRLTSEIQNADMSERQRDALAWKLSAVESITGILFFVSATISMGYFAAWISRPLGDLIYKCIELYSFR